MASVVLTNPAQMSAARILCGVFMKFSFLSHRVRATSLRFVPPLLRLPSTCGPVSLRAMRRIGALLAFVIGLPVVGRGVDQPKLPDELAITDSIVLTDADELYISPFAQ